MPSPNTSPASTRRAALRAELGYDDQPFCIVSVDGGGAARAASLIAELL